MTDESSWLGVDFGTSNTAAMIRFSGGVPRPLLFDGSPLLPSAIAVDPADPAGRLLVGRDALHAAVTSPSMVELYPKLRIDDGTVLLGERVARVETLIGAVLGRVGAEAGRAGRGLPAGTTLTCPAGWGRRRHERLLAAAGRVFPRVRLMLEPVAAALYFVNTRQMSLPERGCAVVYDLGAGTFDASIVRRSGAGFDVLATKGLADAGGLDIDAAIVDYLGATVGAAREAGWARLSGPDSIADRRASRQLWDNVRSAKEALSRTASTLIYVPGLDTEVPLGREQLDELARPILDRTIVATREAIAASGVPADHISAILLTGGSTRLSATATVLHRAFGITPTVSDQPELAVADGATSAAAWPAGSSATTRSPTSAEPRQQSEGNRQRRRPGRRAVLAGVAVISAVAVIVAAAIGAAGDNAEQSRGQAPVATSSSGVGASASIRSSADCLVGSWTVVSREASLLRQGKLYTFRGGAGEVQTFRRDGTMVADYRRAEPIEAVVDGDTWSNAYQGIANGKYVVEGSIVRYEPVSSTAVVTLTRGGASPDSSEVRITGSSTFACDGDTLSTTTAITDSTTNKATLHRTGSA